MPGGASAASRREKQFPTRDRLLSPALPNSTRGCAAAAVASTRGDASHGSAPTPAGCTLRSREARWGRFHAWMSPCWMQSPTSRLPVKEIVASFGSGSGGAPVLFPSRGPFSSDVPACHSGALPAPNGPVRPDFDLLRVSCGQRFLCYRRSSRGGSGLAQTMPGDEDTRPHGELAASECRNTGLPLAAGPSAGQLGGKAVQEPLHVPSRSADATGGSVGGARGGTGGTGAGDEIPLPNGGEVPVPRPHAIGDPRGTRDLHGVPGRNRREGRRTGGDGATPAPAPVPGKRHPGEIFVNIELIVVN